MMSDKELSDKLVTKDPKAHLSPQDFASLEPGGNLDQQHFRVKDCLLKDKERLKKEKAEKAKEAKASPPTGP